MKSKKDLAQILNERGHNVQGGYLKNTFIKNEFLFYDEHRVYFKNTVTKIPSSENKMIELVIKLENL